MDNKVFGRIRKLFEGVDQSSVGDFVPSPLTEQHAQLVALDAAPYGEIVRLGRAFEVHTTAAAAAVVAVPTTAHMLALWNGEPDGGRSLIIDRAWALMAVGTAAAGQGAILGCLGQTRVASLATASLAINALNGNGGKDTKVINTTTALDAVTGVVGNWRVIPNGAGQKPGAAATPGMAISAAVNGSIIVPPGRLFAITVFADVVGSTFTVGLEWHEKKITLG